MRVNRLVLTNDEQTLVSGHIGEFCLWKSVDLVKLSSIPDGAVPSSVGHHRAASVSCLAIFHSTDFAPQVLFTACYNDERDCDIRRWRLQDLERLRCVATSSYTPEVSHLPIFELIVSPNGLKLLTAHNNSRICIWDAESMKLDRSIPLINGSVCITSVIVDREWSTFCAISDSDNKSSGILCYDLIRNEERRRFVCDALPVRMVYSNNDCYLIAGYNDGCIRKWNINTGQMHTVFRSGWSEETECGCGVM